VPRRDSTRAHRPFPEPPRHALRFPQPRPNRRPRYAFLLDLRRQGQPPAVKPHPRVRNRPGCARQARGHRRRRRASTCRRLRDGHRRALRNAQARARNSGTTAANSIGAPTGTGQHFSGTAGDYAILAGGTSGPSNAYLQALTAAGRDFTIAFWVEGFYRPATNQYFLAILSQGASQRFYVANNGTTSMAFFAYTANHTSPIEFGTGNYVLGTVNWDARWFHVAMTRAGATYRGYRNAVSGAPVTPADGADAWYIPTGANDRFVLADYGNPVAPGLCDLSDLRLYDRALSGTEISTLYNAGAGTPFSIPTN
jgi:hypothetical protein